jgi:hypothetical protein
MSSGCCALLAVAKPAVGGLAVAMVVRLCYGIV